MRKLYAKSVTPFYLKSSMTWVLRDSHDVGIDLQPNFYKLPKMQSPLSPDLNSLSMTFNVVSWKTKLTSFL